MTPAQHYSEAEEHLAAAAAAIETDGHEDSQSAWHQRQAQVHALLALAAGPSGVESYAAAVGGYEPPK